MQTSPTLAAQQWGKLYILGKTITPPIALLSVGSYLWAWAHTGQVAYAVAGALTIAIVPWTLIVMRKTNAAIAAYARPRETNDDNDRVNAERLLHRWTMMNFARALFPLVGGVVGLAAALP